MSNQVKDMTWREVQERLREFPVVIVPIGSTEQHGYHLPIGTDVYLAEALAEKTAEKTGALVYPSIHFGYSWSWRDRIGTVTIRQDILREILKDVVRSVERYGVKILIFMNGHEANRSVIKYAIREIQDETDVKVLGMFYPGMEEIYDKYMETPTWGGMFHACEFETSLMLAVKPETVHMERAVQEYPVRPTTYGMDNTSIGELSVSGTYGNPVPATEEKGEMMLEQFTENISAVIEECVKKLVREEIEKMEKDGTFDRLPKKEVVGLKKEYEKLNKNLCGIREMTKLPQAIIIVDSTKEYNAIREAKKLGIPVFGLIDTNCDPDDVDYVLPGNDDAVRSIKVVLGSLTNAIIEANGGTIIDYVSEDDKKPVKEKTFAKKDKKEVKETKEVTEKEEIKEEKPELDLNILTVAELRDLAKKKEIKGYSKMKKEELIENLK